MDIMVKSTQEWLNQTYGGYTGRYNIIPENGITGWTTIYALTRALQIELGIQTTADNFGPTTINLFSQRFPSGVIQQADGDSYQDNIYGIIQGSLWCKGYSTGASSITRHFYGGTGGAIQDLKSDVGLLDSSSAVTLNIMKGLLSMDQYKKISSGNDEIRLIQQSFNRKYENYIGIIPCDGIYGRQMNISMIKVLQAIEGYTPEQATGNFGSGTKSNLPILPDTENLLSAETEQEAILLVRASLCVNGYDIGFSIPYWDSTVNSTIIEFQQNSALNITGRADVDTWMSLLTSKGNPDRAAIACDTRFEMTQERINYLKANGYQFVGRYLTGSEKGLKDDEPQRILDNGLLFFPIFQETLYSDTVSKYNYDLGISDANTARIRASELSIPDRSIIYFAIDFDPQDWEIQNYVIPYFQAINRNKATYKIGIYGTRNTCMQVMELGLAETCFVSDMSTGYSGNMGFKMPNNWNFDQFHEYTITTVSGSWNIDKVAYSGKFNAVSSLVPNSHPELYKRGTFYFIDSHVGESFQLPLGVKRLRYIVEFIPDFETTEGIKSYLRVSLSKRVITPTSDTYEPLSPPDFNDYNPSEDSDWYNVSDLLDYKFTYSCRLPQPLPGETGGTVSIWLEFEY